MNTIRAVRQTPAHYQPPVAVIDRGWRALVKELGASDAIRFFQSLAAGSGDSVQEYREVWGNMSIDEIHEKIVAMKKEENNS